MEHEPVYVSIPTSYILLLHHGTPIASHHHLAKTWLFEIATMMINLPHLNRHNDILIGTNRTMIALLTSCTVCIIAPDLELAVVSQEHTLCGHGEASCPTDGCGIDP